ncbi:hypothetical protein [Sinorhizobium saheli]|uniref:hypothetical protein n=1 Tax=Sinorhizobium saheli TaxID=36856 RepID=UPI001295DECB|nr:hypothetical protein [Sinorhizobium saheli]MQW86010.1 hypothetical protein [Sinorhizobium saheli]
METLDGRGGTVPAGQEERIPAMNAPEYRQPGPVFWFGPLAKGGAQSITFTPTYLHGSPAHVTICGRMTPPSQGPLTPEEAARLYKLADDMVENDPYSRALLKEPKALPE